MLYDNRYIEIKHKKGLIRINRLVNKTDNDYNKLYQIAEYFANKGSVVELAPKMSRSSNFEYESIYYDLIGTKYEGKCPDLKIDGLWYEHEGFVTDNPKRAFRNMLSHGMKQSSRIIIDKPGLTERYMNMRKGTGILRLSRCPPTRMPDRCLRLPSLSSPSSHIRQRDSPAYSLSRRTTIHC